MRPFVFINIASSIDGKISDEKKRQIKISCEEDFKRVDELRADSDAIMVGIGTVLSDNPSLTVKRRYLREKRIKLGKSENPLRVVVDSKAKIPIDAKVLNDEAKTIIAVSERASNRKLKILSQKADVFVCGKERVNLKELMSYLYNIGVRKLMVEGGGTLISSLLRERLVDEIMIYYGNIIIAGKNSPTIADGESFEEPLEVELLSFKKIGNGLLTKWRIKEKN